MEAACDNVLHVLADLQQENDSDVRTILRQNNSDKFQIAEKPKIGSFDNLGTKHYFW